MAIDTSIPRSRRALLAGGIGGMAALVASALGRPLPTSAADGQAVVVGGEYSASSRTRFNTGTTGATALMGQCATASEPAVVGANTAGPGINGQSTSGLGVLGESTSGDGVLGWSTSGTGVSGWSTSGTGASGGSASGAGVSGWSESGEGVAGSSDSFIGVSGESTSGFGVLGSSKSETGVVGESTSGMGISGVNHSAWAPAILGSSGGGSTGVQGYSGVLYTEPAAPAKTGVFGYAAQDSGGRGVTGQSTAGRGVNGLATSGTGVYASATTGYAIRSSGRVRLDKASGGATIAATKTSVVVKPGLEVTSSSFVLLTPRGNLGGRSLWYTTNATTNEITIRVSSAVTTNLQVGWLLLG